MSLLGAVEELLVDELEDEESGVVAAPPPTTGVFADVICMILSKGK
jgi:hypothetical protein